ncbi:uncharacterized protein LOC113870144 [Abrus precatorius]|uniref:Uncharacterized protein LOC113870144 n=1 Tax=Abrus precatorius TaxID=3816 RepID=A0A8B8M1Z1_ABRPR|nr:uncharacterized protein LOC113870144 [Abrus precatorius]
MRQQYSQQAKLDQPQSSSSEPSLADLVKQMATSSVQFQQRTEASIQNLQTHIGQLATTVNELKSQGFGNLPSQSVSNPRNVSAITLRSGKQLEVPNAATEKSTSVEIDAAEEQPESSNKRNSSHSEPNIPLPFPNRVTQNKKIAEVEMDKEIMETFRKVEVNIPLLEGIKQIPKYAKFLKDLCTHRRRLKGNEKVSMGRNVSAIIQPSIPPKCKDPGTFTIPCIIGSEQFNQAMLDLGALINVMPKSVYQSLHIGKLKPTEVVIQLANQSTAHPEGVLEDVLVRVNDLIFLAEFYVLNIEDDVNQPTLILGRPFLKTAKTKIDVHSGTLSMEFGDNKVHFKLHDAMRYPLEEHSVFHLDIIDTLVDDMHANLCAEFPEIVGIRDHFQCSDCDGIHDLCAVCAKFNACIYGSKFAQNFSEELHADLGVIRTDSNSNFAVVENTDCAHSDYSVGCANNSYDDLSVVGYDNALA